VAKEDLSDENATVIELMAAPEGQGGFDVGGISARYISRCLAGAFY